MSVTKSWPTLFVKTAAGNFNFWQIWTDEAVVHTRWGQVGTTSPLTDSYTAAPKNVGRSNATTAAEQAIKEAQAKFDKQIRLKYVHSVQEADSGINIKPMRAYTFDEKRGKKFTWPVHVQPKYNGVRCMAYPLDDGRIRLMSRGGKDYTLKHVQDELHGKIGRGFCLDGELYAHGVSLQTIRHYIETPSEHSVKIKFVCYDLTALPATDMPWSTRYHYLRYFFITTPLQHTSIADTWEAIAIEEIEHHHNRWVGEGYEGAMIRLFDGPYRLAAKSTHLLKYKKFQDAEFEVVGWGVGRDDIIIYQCKQEDGKVFEVRPMGNEEERARLKAEGDSCIGKLLTVRFQERSNDNIPIFPVGVGFRPVEDMDA